MNIILTPDHKYLDQDTGVIYPGVTEVIKGCGLMGYMPQNDINWHLSKGEAVHLATALYDKGNLDESTVDPQIAGYLEAWKKFRKEAGFEPEFVEKTFFHSQYKYCGTLDRNSIDIKAGSPAPWHIVQGAAYVQLTTLPAIWQTVYLKEDGNYKVIVYRLYELIEAKNIFLSALSLFNWKKLNGV